MEEEADQEAVIEDTETMTDAKEEADATEVSEEDLTREAVQDHMEETTEDKITEEEGICLGPQG